MRGGRSVRAHVPPSEYRLGGSVGGLDMTRRSAATESLQTTFELASLDGVGAERDRSFIGPCGGWRVLGAAQELGVRGVKRLVVLEASILEQRGKQLKARLRARGE